MNRIQALYASTIGKKFIAAITGLILLGFLLGHVAGHMKIFTGNSPDGIPHIDEYGQFLKVAGAPLIPAGFALWGARIFLLISVTLHVVVVVQLAMLSAEARPINYVKSKKRAATLPALLMMFSGCFILAFIIFHVLHFTTGTIQFSEFKHGYVYNNMLHAFANPLVSGLYIVAMIVMGFHLNHGVWSLFQTLGLDNPDRNQTLRMAATGLTLLIVIGFILIPVVFMSGQMPPAVDYPHEALMGH